MAILGPAYAAHVVHIDLEDVFPVEQHFAANGLAGRIWNQPHERQRAYAFAASAFAHQPQRFAGHHFVGDVVNRFDDAFVGKEVRLQILNFKQRIHGSASFLWLACMESHRPRYVSGAKLMRTNYHTPHGTARQASMLVAFRFRWFG